MKKHGFLFSILGIWIFILPTAVFALMPYDNFSADFIDKTKWLTSEYSREIKEIEPGNNRLVIRSMTPTVEGMRTYPYNLYNQLYIVDPQSVNSLSAEVTIIDSNIVGSGRAYVYLGGRFYNDGTLGGGYAGDIWAEMDIAITNTGLRAIWSIGRYATSSSTITWLGNGSFTTPIEQGSPYILFIEYDSVAHCFIFKVGSETLTYGPQGLPARVQNAAMPFKGLLTNVRAYSENDSAYICANFDNVYKNGLLYDDFPSAIIDQNKWATYEYVRETSSGNLRLKNRSSSNLGTTGALNNQFLIKNPLAVNEIQAQATLLDYQNPQGLFGVMDITGDFYNEGIPGEGLIGDVIGQIAIGGYGTNPAGFWRVYRYNDAEGNLSTATELAFGTFNTPITLGATYTLGLAWNGTTFTFKFNGETATYTSVTDINPAKGPFKRIRTLLMPEEGKSEATIEALFDNVMVDNHLGGKFPIATTIGRELSIGASYDGTNYLVGIQGDALLHYNVGAQLLSRTGALIGSHISTGRTGGAPMVGYNGTNFLLAWPDDANPPHPNDVIYAQLISKTGDAITSPFSVSTTVGVMDLKNIVCDESKCTVIWGDNNSTGTIYGRDISPAGTFLTPEYTIISGTRPSVGKVEVGVGSDRAQNRLIAIDTGSQILGLIIGPTINVDPFVIATKAPTESCTDHNPVGVAFDGTSYLVVWNDHSDCAVPNPAWDILAQRVDNLGNLIGGSFQVNSANTHRAALPTLAFDGSNYLVTWTDYRNDLNRDGVCDSGEGTCWDIYGQFISRGGSLVGTEFPITTDPGNQFVSPVLFAGGQYLVVWTSGDSFDGVVGDVYGAFIQVSRVSNIDFNGDGNPDLVWRNTQTGRTTIWFMTGATWNGGFADVEPTLNDPSWSLVGVADFNGDGSPDLLWRNSDTGRTTIWYMDGPTWNGGYADVEPTLNDPAWSIVGVADFNQDGNIDLLWRNSDTGRTTIWYMTGPTWNGGYAEVEPTLNDPSWSIVGIADFNGDSNPDLLWRNSGDGRTVIWYMTGPTWNGGYAEVLPTLNDPSWSIVAVRDFNGDGSPDLLWRNTSSTPGDPNAYRTTVWYMDGPVWNGNWGDLLPVVNDPSWIIIGR